jgi:hypothetical protein
MFFAHLKGSRDSAYLSYATDLPGGDCFDRSHRGHTSLSRSAENAETSRRIINSKDRPLNLMFCVLKPKNKIQDIVKSQYPKDK